MTRISVVLVLIIVSIIEVKSQQTKIVAHRGFSSVAPENTLAAFQKAIETGADYIELDVHKTKDDSIVVIHDNSTKRTTSNSKNFLIAENKYDTLSSCKLGYSDKFGDEFVNEKLPSLREALLLAEGEIKVCIEIKVHNAEDEIMKIIEQTKMKDEVIIFSFYKDVLIKIRNIDEEIPILYLKTRATKASINEAVNIRANALGVGPLTLLNKKFIQEAHNKNIEIWRWTVDKEKTIKKLLKLKVDGIITNRPDLAIDMRKDYK